MFSKENSTEPATNILFYFVTTSAVLRDPDLDILLHNMLHDQCCIVGKNCDESNQIIDKRDPPKKARFHSWGGKRSKETPKIVIRTPFRPWGGKRSTLLNK